MIPDNFADLDAAWRRLLAHPGLSRRDRFETCSYEESRWLHMDELEKTIATWEHMAGSGKLSKGMEELIIRTIRLLEELKGHSVRCR